MIDLKEMESAQQSAQRFNEAVAKASHVSFERGYENGYLDGRRDKEKKMSDPNRKEYSYSEKPNSSDLIYRQDALKALRTCYETERIDYTNGNEYINYEQAVHEVEQLSSAQPERKMGKWIEKEDPYGFFNSIPVCSECGCTTKMRERYNFCPNCGADMRGKE